MAENKKSFLVYCDLIHTVRKLSKEDAGELFLHLLEYTNDLNPVTENPIVDIVFEPIKHQLKRDLKAYEKTLTEKSINGRMGNLKRWNLDLFNRVELGEISLEEAENIAKSRKVSLPDSTQSQPFAEVADTDNDTVTDTDTDTVKETNNKNNNTPMAFSFFNSLVNYGFNKDLVNEWLKVRKTKKLTNTETAFNNFIIEVEKTNSDINEVLKECVIKSWGGFKSTWYKEKESSFMSLEKKKYEVSNAFGKQIVWLTDSDYQSKSKDSFNTYKLLS